MKPSIINMLTFNNSDQTAAGLRLVLSDVVGRVFGRLGVAGAILVAAFFLIGVPAGAVVVNGVQTAEKGRRRQRRGKAETSQRRPPG